MKTIIKLENVYKTYQMGKVEVPAIRGLNLKIKEHQFMTIVGASGSGKSTLLHLIGCLDKPTRGRITLDGKDISKLTPSQLAQIRGQKIGFVFQQFNLLSNLTAMDNVILPMIFQQVPKKKRNERAKFLLTEVGLEHRLHHHPNELSGGERQRVAIARALANNPPVLLADEPTGNLDSKTSKKIMKLITDLYQKEGKTMIIVTHDPKLSEYTKENVQLKDGQIVSNGKVTKEVVW